jgi:hypothetical protein
VEQGTSLSGFLARLGGGRSAGQDSARSSTPPGPNLEKYARENRTKELAEFFKSRFPQPDASFDGILCWDIFDYLDKTAAQTLAREMTRLLKPGGALLTFFATVAMPGKEYTRYLVVDDKTFRHKTAPAARGRQQVFVNRDINLMFQGLNVSDSFLLMTRTREIVFRKPEQKAAAGTGESAGDSTADSTAEGAAKTPPTPAASSSAVPELSPTNTKAATATTITTTSTVTAIAAPTTTATPMAMSASTPIGRRS